MLEQLYKHRFVLVKTSDVEFARDVVTGITTTLLGYAKTMAMTPHVGLTIHKANA